MDAATEAMWSEYWTNPTRYLLVASRQHPDELDWCIIYDFPKHQYLLLEDDRLAAAIKRRMVDAGVRVVTSKEFDAFKKPIDDFMSESVEIRRPRAEIDSYLSSIPNPFL